MRCNRCGNENPANHRFCGMCGNSLLAEGSPPAPVRVENQAQGSRESQARTTTAPRTTNPAPEKVPAITGPSFLGLGQAPPAQSGRGANLKHDHHLSRSGNLDYLLDDDEEPRGGAGKVLLILVALLLALGFGYLRWRNGGFAWLTAMAKHATTSQPAESSPATDSAPAPDQSAPPNSPAASPGAAPAPDGTIANGSAAAPQPGPTPSASQPAADSSAAKANGSTGNAAGPDANQSSSPAATPPASTESAPGKEAASAETSSEAAAAPSKDESAKAEATPVPAKPSRTRTTPKPAATKSFDQVTEAERYIYARGGARQDCDRGIRMLRPAAEQSNPKAMISLGALYSTGVCVPRDLPSAYRWFALALRKQPDNEPLQENLNRLWAQMTQPERQLAIKLSQ